MIIVRAPLRISFVGGGTDLPAFYTQTPGKVISATIDKYVYVALNPTPLLKGISARYSEIENVKNVSELKNDRIRESMLSLGVQDFMEIGVFSHMPTGTGLGGSSSFTVSLIKGLSTFLKKRMDRKEIAELACQIEIQRIKEPIGKQDQYAASLGGFNIFQFNPDESVDVEPILIDYKTRIDLQKNMIVFFTGITRKARTVLTEQRNKTQNNSKALLTMTKLVDTFHKKLLRGKFKELGELLHENWLIKKTLASKVSNEVIDALYDTGIKKGAWGGKILGAGGGGCILFLIDEKKKDQLRDAMLKNAQKLSLKDFQEIPVQFVQSGVEVISNSLFN